ncbi:MAG: phage baseplate plug protein [Bilophila wadsworthia]
MAYLLPLTSDGERTFSVVLGSNTYFFRSYYVRGQESAWLLDISDAGGSMLASGVKLVPGSPNCLAGYGDAFNGENIVVALSRGRPGDEEAPGDTLNVLVSEGGIPVYARRSDGNARRSDPVGE